MNFLEGFRRLFILISSFLVIGISIGVWVDNEPLPRCENILSTKKAEQDISKMSDDELFAMLKSPASAPSAKQDNWSDRYHDGGVGSASISSKEALPFSACAPWLESRLRQFGYAAIFAALSAMTLAGIWLCLRWVIVGFIPSLAKNQ